MPCAAAERITAVFRREMDNDLQVGAAFDAVAHELDMLDPLQMAAGEAASVVASLRSIDAVLLSIFPK